jgi:hypothetical protein
MVKGLDIFREHFDAFAERYILIGGTACELVMQEVGLAFRATKDLDIVLCLDAVDADFGQAFWTFIQAGGYEFRETAAGHPRFYRFQKPSVAGFPVMLELFSRAPAALSLPTEARLSPIPVDGELSSLSAILLDEAYYSWLQTGRRIVDSLPVVGAEILVPLKAAAWLDLRRRREAGDAIDSRAIRKHRNDVLRLFQVLDPAMELDPPEQVGTDLRAFLDALPAETIDLKSLGLGAMGLEEVVETLRRLYRL